MTFSYRGAAIGIWLTAMGQFTATAQESSISARPELSASSSNSVAAAPGGSGNVAAAPVPPKGGSGPASSSNPLSTVPLGSLTATRDRPIFSPSRRPPDEKPISQAPNEEANSDPPGEPLGPSLVLLGAVAARTESMALFRDQRTGAFVRLKVGDKHSGWTLRTVRKREVTFNKGQEISVISIETP
jgi:hypothetical protein